MHIPPEAFVLITIPNSSLYDSSTGFIKSGTLALERVTMSVPEALHDCNIYLVFRLIDLLLRLSDLYSPFHREKSSIFSSLAQSTHHRHLWGDVNDAHLCWIQHECEGKVGSRSRLYQLPHVQQQPPDQIAMVNRLTACSCDFGQTGSYTIINQHISQLL